MLRTWEYITERCLLENCPDAARLSRKMDEAIAIGCNLTSHTTSWIKAYMSAHLDTQSIWDIASTRAYCSVCAFSKISRTCTGCPLGNLVGICSKANSLFIEFKLALCREKDFDEADLG